MGDTILSQLQDYTDKVVAQENIPGLSVAVRHNNKLSAGVSGFLKVDTCVEATDSVIHYVESLAPQIEQGFTREKLQISLPVGGARNALDLALWDLECKQKNQTKVGRPVERIEAVRLYASLLLEHLHERVAQYRLTLNQEKTQIISFHNTEKMQFDFLGFTFYWGKGIGGKPWLKVKTQKKQLHKKLQEFDHWVKKVCSQYNWEGFAERIKQFPLGELPPINQLRKFGWSTYV